MATKIQLRRDTAANWETSNPVLSQGEQGLALDHSRIKIGDGVTAWKDLPYDGDALKITSDNSKFGFHTVSGVKEFTFNTRGYIFQDIVATATTNDGTFTVDSATYPGIIKQYEKWDLYNNTYAWINGAYGSSWGITNITINGTIYTFTMNNDPTINTGDTVTVRSWSQGTRATWDGMTEYTEYRANQPTSNSNVVQVNLTDATMRAKLLANPTKSSIVFDDKPCNWYNNNNYHLMDSARTIKSVTQVDGTYYDIAFSGPPISVRTDDSGFTLAAKSSLTQVDLNYVAVSRSLYPELSEYIYYSGGTVTFNGTTRNISGIPDAYGDTIEYPDIGLYGDSWVLHLDGNITCDAGDTLTIEWTKPGTNIDFEVYDPGQSAGGNFIQWFDWKKDLPFFSATNTNGVTSGRIDWAVKITRPLENTLDFQNSLKPVGSGITNGNSQTVYVPSTVYFDNINYDYDRWFGNTHDGDHTNQCNLFWRWNEDGIFFKEYSYGNRSQDVIVKVAYKMDLFITPDDQYWD
ncbi:hypothetical protein UFOVP245_168 [uncultured Caudovirales phage]|uniref:Major tropism determinant N-terminal domain-containing protein n=1 Tax=uncultured Caudovirales phage TaxID=2100421 RepID=A0A6J7WTQ6_9CAUD|nr:hypothetical protein UFOVP245_168 [uncultured Caudovirales phage]